MAIPSRWGVDKKINSMEGLSAYENGGKGSGNFGHSGRPGEVGGSGSSGGGVNEKGFTVDDLPKAIRDGYATSSSKYEDITRMSIVITPKGNLNLRYDGKDVASIGSSRNLLLEASRLGLIKGIDEEFKTNGGKGSGNFGHSGRPGERGGSGSGKGGSSKGGREVSLKGMSVREKYEAIREGDEVHFIPKDNLPNFDRKIKVDFIRDGVPHYGLSETSDGHTYPFWAVKDIKKIIRKKNKLELNGGKGSGNFGHSGRPGHVGGSGSGKGGSKKEESSSLDGLYSVGDKFKMGGREYEVQQGEHGLQATAEGGKIVTALPSEVLRFTAEYPSGVNPKKRVDAIESICDTLNLPSGVKSEVMRYAEKERKVAQGDTSKKSSDSMESYFRTAVGALKGYSSGNGGVSKPRPSSERKRIETLIDSLGDSYDKIITTAQDKRGKDYSYIFSR